MSEMQLKKLTKTYETVLLGTQNIYKYWWIYNYFTLKNFVDLKYTVAVKFV